MGKRNMYSREIERALEKAHVKPGDRVHVTKPGTAKGYHGILLPRIDTGDPSCLIVKLDTGYNAGVAFTPELHIEKSGEGTTLERFPEVHLEEKKGLPNLALIATGGTIGSRVDYRTGGVHMLLSPQEILFGVPELSNIANLTRVLSPYKMASEDLAPAQWKELAELVAQEVNREDISGVIITHGTDTLGYTAAALSFMLPNLSKPVAIVGAQRSPDRGSFDGAMNLVCAARYCASDIAEVAAVMHATTNDDYCHANPSTKVRKMHSSRRDAFRTINALPYAKVFADGRFEHLREDYRERTNAKIEADTKFEEKVALIKAYPGSDPGIIDHYISEGYKGIVIEGTGLGHVPTQPKLKKHSWIPHVEKATKKGVVIAATTQCLYGRTNPYVYTNLRLLSQAGAVFCQDMLPETAYVKLGFLLAHKEDSDEVKRLMTENLAGEINTRHTDDIFLN